MPYIGQNLQAAFQSYQIIDDISGSFNGVTTSFPLRVNGVTPSPFPINPQQCLIIVGGVPQEPDLTGVDGFTFSGSNIVLSSAPAAGEKFWGVILAGADYVNVGANFPSGSALAPSITFDSDIDTGIYNSGANQLSFTTGGTERARIDSSGRFLVGTSSTSGTAIIQANGNISLRGTSSGYVELSCPAVGGNNTLVLPANNGSADQALVTNGSGALSWADRGRMVLATAQNTTSGTSIDFTGIPSWVKRVTVMLNGVSTNGTSLLQIRLGTSGGVEATGYTAGAQMADNVGTYNSSSTTGFLPAPAFMVAAAGTLFGSLAFINVSGNAWVASGGVTDGSNTCKAAGGKSLSGTLDRIRLTTVNGTDTFDAGSVNILYEG
jgi:hypothetical protein